MSETPRHLPVDPLDCTPEQKEAFARWLYRGGYGSIHIRMASWQEQLKLWALFRQDVADGKVKPERAKPTPETPKAPRMPYIRTKTT